METTHTRSSAMIDWESHLQRLQAQEKHLNTSGMLPQTLELLPSKKLTDFGVKREPKDNNNDHEGEEEEEENNQEDPPVEEEEQEMEEHDHENTPTHALLTQENEKLAMELKQTQEKAKERIDALENQLNEWSKAKATWEFELQTLKQQRQEAETQAKTYQEAYEKALERIKALEASAAKPSPAAPVRRPVPIRQPPVADRPSKSDCVVVDMAPLVYQRPPPPPRPAYASPLLPLYVRPSEPKATKALLSRCSEWIVASGSQIAQKVSMTTSAVPTMLSSKVRPTFSQWKPTPATVTASLPLPLYYRLGTHDVPRIQRPVTSSPPSAPVRKPNSKVMPMH